VLDVDHRGVGPDGEAPVAACAARIGAHLLLVEGGLGMFLRVGEAFQLRLVEQVQPQLPGDLGALAETPLAGLKIQALPMFRPRLLEGKLVFQCLVSVFQYPDPATVILFVHRCPIHAGMIPQNTNNCNL